MQVKSKLLLHCSIQEKRFLAKYKMVFWILQILACLDVKPCTHEIIRRLWSSLALVQSYNQVTAAEMANLKYVPSRDFND